MATVAGNYKMKAYRTGEKKPFMSERSNSLACLYAYKNKEFYRIRLYKKNGRKWDMIYTEI